MNFSFTAGLILRDGARTLQLVRQLDDVEYQLEDMATRRPLNLTREEILKRIYSKRYEIVVDNDTTIKRSAMPKAKRLGLHSLVEKQQDDIRRRMEYIRAMQKAHVTIGQRRQIEKLIPKVAARIEDAKPPSASTLMSWARDYRKAGVAGLVNLNKARSSSRRKEALVDQVVTEVLRDVYFTPARHTLRHALDVIRDRLRKLVKQQKLAAEKATFSLASLSRRVREVDYYHRIASREGPDRARMLCRTVMNGAGASYPLERVEIDHTPLNWVVICDRTGLPLGRPTLTVLIDSYSNYVLGFYLSFYGPGLTSVSGVLRNAISPKQSFTAHVELKNRWLAEGIPDLIVVDNGLEFHSRAFLRMMWELSCDLHYARVRTPWVKPHVEGFFSTLDHFTLDAGRIRKHAAGAFNFDPKKDAAITFSKLVAGLIMFVTDVHPFQINERKLTRPIDLFTEGMERCPIVTYPGSWDGLRLASALSKELTLGPGGIELLGLPYGQAELLPLRRRYGERIKVVVKWDPDDMKAVYVQDPKTLEWIESACRWPDYADGLSWNQHRLIRSFAREKLKRDGSYEALEAARLRLHEHWMDATSRKSRADAQLAGRFSGITSARVDSSPPPLLPAPAVQRDVIADVEITRAESVVPDFDAFVMA